MELKRHRAAVVAATVAAVTAVIAFATVGNADATAGLDPIQVAQVQKANCQLLAAHSTGTQHQRAQDCVTDQTKIINLLTRATPSPTGTTAPPTTAPATTPPATTPPATTPPVTTPPVTTPPPTIAPPATTPPAGGFPDASNTGPDPAVHLTVIDGDFSASASNVTITGIEVHGCTIVTGVNVHFVDSRFLGDCFYAVHNEAPGLVMDRVEISCEGGSGTGITDSEYKIHHGDIHGCENGLNISAAGNADLTDSWVHDLTFVAGSSHTDGIQVGSGAGNINILHNTIVVCSDCNSPLIMWNELSSPQNHDTVVDGNYMAGGRFDLYCPREDSVNNTASNNHMKLGWSGAYTNSCGGSHMAFVGNVDADTLAPIDAA